MYRESNEGLVETIERLEREIEEMRALRAAPRPREKMVLLGGVLAGIMAVMAGAALLSANARADEAETRFEKARVLVQEKTQTLGECEALAERQDDLVREYALRGVQ
jgi:hypothetical protein